VPGPLPLNAYNKKVYPDQIAATRAMTLASGRPYVIENVVQAPLLSRVILCGSMFGLRVYRHRGFETSFPITALSHPPHVQVCAWNGYLPDAQRFMPSVAVSIPKPGGKRQPPRWAFHGHAPFEKCASRSRRPTPVILASSSSTDLLGRAA
jgi:hypothetical protein